MCSSTQVRLKTLGVSTGVTRTACIAGIGATGIKLEQSTIVQPRDSMGH
jgi:hypothetical protein